MLLSHQRMVLPMLAVTPGPGQVCGPAYRGGMGRKHSDAVRITSATRSHSDDINARQRRYLISMGIRTLCFVAAVVVFVTTGQGWLMWVLVIASFILPYVAVVMANAGASTDPGGPEPFGPDPSRKSLEPPPGG